jgi:anti-sigma regulatory factor (Ser/Thr protein kinase)
MPLGLMPDMGYEENQTTLLPGESVLFYSDGLIEAHNSEGEMFGTARLRELSNGQSGGADLIEFLLAELTAFAGSGWEQEDDATFVTLKRSAGDPRETHAPGPSSARISTNSWQTLAEFGVPSAPGNERQAMEQVADALQLLDIPAARMEKLKTAVAEATMNAMEHGNQYQQDVPVSVKVLASDEVLAVRVTDQGRAEEQPVGDMETPDLDAKLAGLQAPRGWGLFLIQNMVDEVNVYQEETQHTIELIVELKGDSDAG